MEHDLMDPGRAVDLSIICGVGQRGASVVRLLSGLLGTLPSPMDNAVRAIDVPDPSGLPEALSARRADLVNLANTDRILQAGWKVEGRDVGVVHVRHFVVWSESEFGVVLDPLRSFEGKAPTDSVIGVLIADDPVMDTSILRAAMRVGGIRYLLVGPQTMSGEGVSPEMVDGSVAGALLLSVLPALDMAPQPVMDRPASFGLAALHGLVGRSRCQLARHLAVALLAEQNKPDEEVDPLQFDAVRIREMIEANLYENLAPRLLDSRLFRTGRDEKIPAVLDWDEHAILQVTLDGAAVSLGLPAGEPEAWSRKLRRLSRVYDMTTAVRWRLQLESAADELCRTVPEDLEAGLLELIRAEPYGPALARHVIDRIRRDHESDREAMADPTDSFDQALEELDKAVAERPDPVAMWMRTTLWTAPAILVFAMAIDGLYTGGRGVLFPIIFVCLAVTGTVLAGLLYLGAARKRILDARDRAVKLLIGRQESILSRNILGYLGDILRSIVPVLARIEARADEEKRIHDETLESLRKKIGETITAPVTFEPVLMKPDEYQEAFRMMNADVPALVAKLGEDGGLSAVAITESSGETYEEYVTGWCDEFIRQARWIRRLGIAELWGIRRRNRGGSDLPEAIDALRRRAVPLGVIKPQSENELLVASSDVDLEDVVVDEGEEGHRASAKRRVHPAIDLPMIAVWRAGHTETAVGEP